MPMDGKARKYWKVGEIHEKFGQYSRYDGSEIFEASYYTLHLDS